MPGTPLFPPFLNQGSTGPAVNLLGLLLIVTENQVEPIVLDGQYPEGGAIAKAVKKFQIDAGFTGEDVDSNFGPKTRLEFWKRYGANVDDLDTSTFVGETAPAPSA